MFDLSKLINKIQKKMIDHNNILGTIFIF